jgi:DNA-binding Xre family transcriptional regulator
LNKRELLFELDITFNKLNVKINKLKGGAIMAREITFINLEAEILRSKLSKAELASMIGISNGSMSSKLTGKTEFNLSEMLAIRERLETSIGQDFTLDYLFKRGE